MKVPKLNNNDDTYVLVEWLVETGTEVKEGDPVAVLETSKSAEEVTADATGVLRQEVALMADCAPGDLLATIGASVPIPAPIDSSVTPESHSGPVITAPARAAMDELGVTEEQVATLGVNVVRRADVERLAAETSTPTAPLSKVQQAVGRAVTLSHATIPAAYAVLDMPLDEELAATRRLTKQVRRPVGLAELFVMAVARLHTEFPLFFATLGDDRTKAVLSETANVGVTFDTGEGLYVPVVHDAGSKSLQQVATRLMEYRVAAMKGDFSAADLADANIAVTLHHDGGITLAIPFIFPGTACALAVTAPQEVLHLDGGEVRSRQVAHIGLAYDHRLINGRDAALFLKAIQRETKALAATE
ncbi:dehydrogenase [Herbidospora sp. NEAU-GS84]|uniref:Dihydrolipoamide acetyltransferase component of pyruvate dehydrogenase complex n=1 Tax=Herbidospora solisilvae TaxID=2696284 RepID=A0A7C9JEK9_9ACTN|nr:2-oxo acid dehydrogenase subunit E2 [Herbidospora solisilvae]NAS23183.1 dehydrogenase [Herbidospora solisilvae]